LRDQWGGSKTGVMMKGCNSNQAVQKVQVLNINNSEV